MVKKRAITLLEIMIVILLIGLIGGVVSYNLKGTLDKGKVFRTEQGIQKLADILNMEIQTDRVNIDQLVGRTDTNNEVLKKCIKNSGLVPDKDINAFILDGWKEPYLIAKNRSGNEVRVISQRLNDYRKTHGKVSVTGSAQELTYDEEEE